MKKYLLLLIVFSLKNAKAQDQIFKSDNTKLLVKITEISPDEIKYKLFNNLNGPVYVASKTEVSLIIYENGQHEVISKSASPGQSQAPVQFSTNDRPAPSTYARHRGMSKEDSLAYFKNTNSLSLNFLSFMNMELGVIYQKDFLKSNFNITIPLSFGIQTPGVTQSVYFGSNNTGTFNNNNYYYNSSYGRVNLDRKLFEVGFGINYYPSLKYPVNYYIGPAFRYMQYECQQTYHYNIPGTYNPSTGSTTGGQNGIVTKNSTLSRYCMTVTNGLIFRTRSRLMVNMFGSIGFKNDELNNSIQDPITLETVRTISQPFSLYFWTGFLVGFTF